MKKISPCLASSFHVSFFFHSILDELKEKYGLLVVYLKLDFLNNKLAIDHTSSSMSVSVSNIQAYISVRTGLFT